LVSNDIKEVFERYLKETSHRITEKRFLVLGAAMSMDNHFDADELYLKMKESFLKVSRATVYKTLELMSECKILTKHHFKGERSRYEKEIGREHHYHIICLKCQHIIEFEEPRIKKILEELCVDKNLNLIDHSFQAFSTCKDKDKCKYYKTKKTE
jgi:Fur family ferric uptake transcriptional regulator